MRLQHFIPELNWPGENRLIPPLLILLLQHNQILAGVIFYGLQDIHHRHIFWWPFLSWVLVSTHKSLPFSDLWGKAQSVGWHTASSQWQLPNQCNFLPFLAKPPVHSRLPKILRLSLTGSAGASQRAASPMLSQHVTSYRNPAVCSRFKESPRKEYARSKLVYKEIFNKASDLQKMQIKLRSAGPQVHSHTAKHSSIRGHMLT